MAWNRYSKKEKKDHKYAAQKVKHAGYSFASKLEASVYNILYLQMKAGEIAEIQVQDSVYLTDARILFKPDFKCTRPDGSVFWAEAKGFRTPEYAIKKRLWKHYGPGQLLIYEGSHLYPKLSEEVIPLEQKCTCPQCPLSHTEQSPQK